MAGNTVTLTFAGESKSLSKTFDDVGKQSEQMASRVDKASESVHGSARGFGELEESAGRANQRFIGLGDSIAGPADVLEKWKEGDLAGVAVGFADIAGGLEDFIIPTFGKLGTLIKTNVWPTLVSFGSSIYGALIAPLVTAGTALFTTVIPAVWSFTAALLANPITWIVLGIVALIVILDLLINHFDLVKAAWSAVTAWIGDRIHDIGAFFTWLADSIPKWLGAAWDWIKSAFWAVVQFHIDAGNKLIDIFKTIGSAILAPFKWAFNEISDAWNKTIGSLSWHVPDWVPFIGGNTISAPRLPHFHTGGVVPGTPGSDVLAVLQAGETVIPRTGAGGSTNGVVLSSDGSELADAIVAIVRKAVFRAGGDAQTALGS